MFNQWGVKSQWLPPHTKPINMKNVISFAISLLAMASMMLMASCSNEVDDLVPENATSDEATWTEPYHVKGASPEEVESFMTSWKQGLSLSIPSSTSCLQLVYSKPSSMEGVVYSFSFDRTLYSIIDTEPMAKWNEVLEYMNLHYALVSSSESTWMFTTQSHDMVVSLDKVTDNYFNVSYSFVTQ